MNWIQLQLIKIVHAQIGQPTGGMTKPSQIVLQPPIKGDLSTLIGNVVDFFIKIGAAIMPAIILYAAFQMLTSGGDPEKFQAGKKTILYAVIGYAIILIARGVVFVVAEILGAKVPVQP